MRLELSLQLVRVARQEASKPDATGPSCDPGLRKGETPSRLRGKRHTARGRATERNNFQGAKPHRRRNNDDAIDAQTMD